MRVPSAKRIARHGQERGVERATGTGRHILGFSASRAVEQSIPNLARLPVKKGASALQNSDGTFIAGIKGYNA